MTQRERVLRALKDAGPRGVHSFGFFQARIPRAAARIRELRERGYTIDGTREGKGIRYALRAGPGGGNPSSPTPASRPSPRRVAATEPCPDARYALVWDYDPRSPNYMRAYWERPAEATQGRLAA